MPAGLGGRLLKYSKGNRTGRNRVPGAPEEVAPGCVREHPRQFGAESVMERRGDQRLPRALLQRLSGMVNCPRWLERGVGA